MADLSIYERIGNIKPFQFNMPKLPTPFERFEDEQKIKAISDKNKLSQVMGKYYQSGSKDNESLYKELAGAGLYEQIPEMQKQQAMAEKAALESEKLKIEVGLKTIDSVARRVAPWLNKPVTPENQQGWSQFKQGLAQEFGKNPDLPDQFDPQVIAEKYQQGLSVAEQHAQKWKEYESRLSQYKELGIEKRHAESLAETRRGHDIQASNQGWAQTVNPKTGLPVWTKNRQEGMPVYTPTGIANARALPANAINKFTDLQTAADNSKMFEQSFKDEYAGQPIIGNVANAYGNIAGDDSGQSAWWKNYQANKNETRNKLFGGALTPTEKAEYDKQEISPGMDPKEVRKRLTKQREIADIGYSRIVKNYGKGGYNVNEFITPDGSPDKPVNDDVPEGWTDEDEAAYQREMGGQ